MAQARPAHGVLGGVLDYVTRLKHRTMLRTRFVAFARRVAARLDGKLYDLRKTGYGVDTLRNWWLDRRYGGYCGGTIKPPEYDRLDANAVESSDYTQLEMLFDLNDLRIAPDDVLVDVGCGKGRVLNFWLQRGHRNRMVGLELNEDVAAHARERLKAFPNVTIVAGDALQNLPADGTFFYVYNPFGASVMTRFAERLQEHVASKGAARIIYNNCRHIEVFEADPRWQVEFLNVGWRRIRAARITFARERQGAGVAGAPRAAARPGASR